MAPTVICSGVSVAKSIHQQRRSTSPGVPQVSIARISPEPVNGNAKFTCRKANRISLAEKIVLYNSNSSKNDIIHQCGSVPTGVSTKVDTSKCDSAPLKKRRRVFIPVRNDLSDAELTWHAKNSENLLHNYNSSGHKSALNQQRIHSDPNNLTSRVLIIRATDQPAQALQFLDTYHNKPRVPAQLEEKIAAEAGEVPGGFQRAAWYNLGVTEVNKVTGGDGSALTESSSFAEPPTPVPDHSKQQNSTDVDQRPEAVIEPSRTHCKGASNDLDSQPRESKDLNKKCSSKSKIFNFRAIAENLDVDGCISSNNARRRFYTNEELQEDYVDSQVLMHHVYEVPAELVSPCKTNSRDCTEQEKSEKANLKLSSETKNFDFKAVAKNLGVGECISPNNVGSRLSTYEEMLGECVVPLVQAGHDNHKVLVIEPSKSHSCEGCGSDALHLSTHGKLCHPPLVYIAVGSEVDDCARSSNPRSRFNKNEEAQLRCVVSHVPANSDSGIPTVVQKYTAKTFLNPNEVSPKREKKKRRLNPKKNGASSEFLELLPGVTEYTSFIGWAGGKMIVSRPTPSKEEHTSPQPGKIIRSDTYSAENHDSRVISAVEGNEQDMDKGFVDGHSCGRVTADALGSVYSNDPSTSIDECRELSFDESNNDGISATHSEEVDGMILSDTGAAKALLSFKNSLNEKIAKADAEMADALAEKDDQVMEFCDSLEPDVSSANLSNLDPENINDTLSVKTNVDEAALNSKNNLNEVAFNTDVQLAVELGIRAEQVGTVQDSQDFDVSSGNFSRVDPENMSDIKVSFRSYIRSLVRPEGFPDHPQMKFKCLICSELFPCYIDLEVHSVKKHCEAWENIKNSYLRILTPYLHGGFLNGHPQLKCKCVFCSRLFSHRSDLEGHLAERHYGDDPYECPFCLKRFRNAFSYSNHLNEHIYQNDYPSYPCNACSACFSSQWQLDLHSQTHVFF